MMKEHSIPRLCTTLTSWPADLDDQGIATAGFDTVINLIDGMDSEVQA